jgi:hypothetical protein
MAALDLTYLRKLLGDAWIDAEVFGEKPTHLLGRWQKNDPNSPWMEYTERLVENLLTSKNIKFDSEVLAKKLKSKSDFVSTLAEMEYAAFLAQQAFTVTLEPTAPLKGPDIRADCEGVPYFVEIRTVGFSKEEDRRNLVTNEVFAKLKTVPSSYFVTLTVGDEYKPATPKLRDAITDVVQSLSELKERAAKEATLYHLRKDEAVLVLPEASIPNKYHYILHEAHFVAQFRHLGEELPGTLASFFEQRKNPPEPVKDHERLKNILEKKRDQLPKGSRGIIVLEVSEPFMLSDFSVERALYGDLQVEFPRVKSPGEAVGEMTARRNNRGFLLHTSRVSAIVIQKRKVEEGEVKSEWQVYPTNRANADTIRLSLAELKRFGDIGDRKHLSAENAPNQNETTDSGMTKPTEGA